MLLKSSDKTRLFYLVILSFVGSFILSLASMIPGLFSAGNTDSINNLRFNIFLQDVLVLMMPAFLVFKWSFAKPIYQLGISRNERLPNLLFLTLGLFIFSSPAISVLSQWNEQVIFPEFLKELEIWFREMEDAALVVTDRFLDSRSYIDLLLNLFLIAAMAAMAEEIFFRGALQQLLHRWLKSGHAAVWIAAFIFSAIHLQFYGFIPRLLMGVFLGYLFFYSGNLWVPIFYHFINNAWVILFKFFFENTEFYNKLENMELNWMTVSAAIVSVIVSIFMLNKIRLSCMKSNVVTDAENYE